jgi:ABC-type ATPase with predicted acetyltransferase domain
MMGDFDTIITRVQNPIPKFPLLQEMYVERGERADWDLLSHLHYKSHSTPVGAKYWRLVFRGETIGVCVFGMSRPLLKERHAIFPKLTPGKDTQISNIHRYRYINDNFRVIGRFVVDTMFRSSGVAYRFANLASRQYGFQFTEIQSSMSKYNLFAQKAGFTFTKPIRSIHYDKGLNFMRKWFAAHPADQEALMEEYSGMSKSHQQKVENELKAFYFKHSPLEKTGSRRHYSKGVVDDWPVRRTISKIQGLCFSTPLYGIYRSPDFGKELPERLPLLAFDMQKPDQPLDLVKLKLLQ